MAAPNIAANCDKEIVKVPATTNRQRRSYYELTEANIQAFWRKVDKSAGPDGCWMWTGGKSKQGYGSAWVGHHGTGGHTATTHRMSLFMATGELGDVAQHSCDVRACVNPAHLSWGTIKTNAHDSMNKGRAVPPARGFGESHSGARLTNDDVLAIRAALARGAHQRDVAHRFGVSQPHISTINRRATWSHLPVEGAVAA